MALPEAVEEILGMIEEDIEELDDDDGFTIAKVQAYVRHFRIALRATAQEKVPVASPISNLSERDKP